MKTPGTRPRAVFFDLDGTLLDTAPDFIRVVNLQRTRHGLAPLPTEQIRNTVSNGARALILLSFGLKEGDADFKVLHQELLDLYLDNLAVETCLFPGMSALLEQLETHGLPWGIVTNKPRRYTDPLLQQLGLDTRTAVTLCPDDVKNTKPHPEPLLKAAGVVNCPPATCWYVGDHERDILSGKAAGMTTIAARYGYLESPAAAQDWLADYIIDHPSELLDLFQS